MVSGRSVLRESSFAALYPGRILFDEKEKHGLKTRPYPARTITWQKLIRRFIAYFRGIGRMV
jgi:hypothetical protein